MNHTSGFQTEVRFSSGVLPPHTAAPPLAVDCHVHIYDHSFPFAPGATLRPPAAYVADYHALAQRLGLRRVVLVAPSSYGTDNRSHLAALQALGQNRARMVAVVTPSVTDPEIDRLHSAGVRGARFNLVESVTGSLDELEQLAPRLAERGWHCQLNWTADALAAHQERLGALPCPLVIDHLGRIPQPEGLAHPGHRAMLALLEAGNTWVKLSGAYLESRVGATGGYRDTTPVATSYVRTAPERCVWGSDWPHVTEPLSRKPDDATLFDLLTEWAPDHEVRDRILTDNPAALYDFPRNRP